MNKRFQGKIQERNLQCQRVGFSQICQFFISPILLCEKPTRFFFRGKMIPRSTCWHPSFFSVQQGHTSARSQGVFFFSDVREVGGRAKKNINIHTKSYPLNGRTLNFFGGMGIPAKYQQARKVLFFFLQGEFSR